MLLIRLLHLVLHFYADLLPTAERLTGFHTLV